MRIILLLLLLLPAVTNGQNITTYAGTGINGYSGDGGPATTAELADPIGVAVDGSGNLYITDGDYNVVRKVTPAGIITTIAGSGGGSGYSGDGGPAIDATFWGPVGIAVDGSGNLFIVDNSNNVIRKIDTSGIITTVAGNKTLGYGYSGDGGPATAAQLNEPYAVAVDLTGNFFIADLGNDVVRRVDTSGIITTFAGIYALGGYSGDGGPATDAELSGPNGVTVDDSGNVYISDASNNMIRKVSTSGIITTYAGSNTGAVGYSGDGGPATAATLNFPSAVSINSSGNLYIADNGNNVIRKVTPSGTIYTVAGDGIWGYTGNGGVATSAELKHPGGVAADAYSNYYIGDIYDFVVRKVDTLHFATEANFTVSNYSVCHDDSCITFTNISTGAIDSIRWFVHGVTIADPHSDTINVCFPSESDTVKLYVFGSGGIDSAAKVVTIHPVPHPTIDTSCFCFAGLYLSCQWYEVGSSTPIPGATSTLYTPSGIGCWYALVDSIGCIGSSDTACTYPEGVGKINGLNTDVQIYPNPATTSITITSAENIATISISDVLGQTVCNYSYNSPMVQISVANLPNGVYFVKVNGNEVNKFVKQ